MLEYLPKRRRVSGLRIDPHKADSTRLPIAEAFVPEQLYMPVETHRGTAPKIIVAAGQRVLRGETLAAGQPGSGVADVHASSSGVVREISTLDVQTTSGSTAVQCVVIDTDGRDAAIEGTGATDTGPASDTRARQIEQIRRAGIVGLGGAAVSTSWKLTRHDAARTLIINGAECEPYISCDDLLMRERATDILAGSLTLCDLLRARQCIVAVERDKPQAIAALRAAAANLDDTRLSLAELPSIYPAGGERQLVELLLDTEVPSGCYPTDIGVFCQNVGTACAVHHALNDNQPL
ncbi:MAG: RnfABCDGE type electron transport complex subunit C, partial [Gammaproteobacteria bacterium]